MTPARVRFVENLTRARNLRALAMGLTAHTTSALDLTDMFRAAIVLAVSALDTFIHEITRIGMLDVYQGTRPRTDSFNRFAVSMDSVQLIELTPGTIHWFESEIRRQHSFLSFQMPDKIADAVRLFSAKKLWEEVGRILGIAAKAAKIRLVLVIDRRNKIAHEADMDPTTPGVRWPIDAVLVDEAITTLEQIGVAIFTVVTT